MFRSIAIILGLSIATGAANAALVDQGNGLVYDTNLNLLWDTDANLFFTQATASGDPAVFVQAIISANPDSWWVTAGAFNTDTGQMSHWGADAWVHYLDVTNYKGYHGWRLPSVDVNGDWGVVDCSSVTELVCRDNEAGYLYFQNHVTGLSPSPFTNLQDYYYWSIVDPSDSWMAYEFYPFLGFASTGTVDLVGPFAMVVTVPPPTAVDDGSIAATEGVAQIIPVGANDMGFTTPVTVTVTTQPTKGTITAVSAPGPAAGMTITYTANIGAVGADSFVYQMTDGTPASDSATVTLNISNGVPDTVPDPFAFTDQTGVARSKAITSAPVTISGINTAAPISIGAGSADASDYSVGCTGTFTTSDGEVNNGQTVCVRHTSSASFSTATNTILNVGGVTSTFTSTTAASSGGGGGGGTLDGWSLLALGLAGWLRRKISS